MDRIGSILKYKNYLKGGLTLITPTGDRQHAIRQCFKYMDRQTYISPVQWLIVDDGKIQTDIPVLSKKLNIEIHHIRRAYDPSPKKSFLGNLEAAIVKVQYDKVLFIEDDDWYSPEYFKLIASRLDNYALVGETPNRYYNIKENYWASYNTTKHSSLCNTALRSSEVLPYVRWAISKNEVFVDYQLWKVKKFKKFLFEVNEDDINCVGIKGLPGRGGIGSGHRPIKNGTLRNGYKQDRSWEKLSSWIGAKDTEWYKQFSK